MTKKTINVNPMYLKASNSASKKQKKSRKNVSHNKQQTNKLRSKLLSKIKDHRQQKNIKNKVNTLSPNADASDFDNSMSYLQGIVKNKTSKRQAKKQRPQSGSSMNSTSVGVIPNAEPNTVPNVEPNAVPNAEPNAEPNIQPPYSCLKNGSRPTYRTWKNRQNPNKKLNINAGVLPTPTETERSKQLKELKEKQTHKPQFNQNTNIQTTPAVLSSAPPPSLSSSPTLPPPPPPPLSPPPISLQSFDDLQKNASIAAPVSISTTPVSTHKKNKQKYTRYKLGKDGKRVGVLIKDKYTRKKIKEGHRQLKRKSIVEVKNYLKEHQLLKAGSAAPNDVLRATYEQAILAGEVNNKADDALMHNYLAKN